MKISQQQVDQGWKVSMEGELNLQSCPSLEKVLKTLCQSKPKQLILDMRAVDYIDSSGLRLLVEYHHQQQYLQGKLILQGLSERVKNVISVTHLDQVFTIQDGTDVSRP